MTSDSNLFVTEPRDNFVPLYEAKMIHIFDHRFSTYENATLQNINEGNLPQFTPEMHKDPNHFVLTRYWVKEEDFRERLVTKRNWFIGFRDVTGNASERTAIFSIVPHVALGNNTPILIVDDAKNELVCCLLANLNSLAFDYVARQKVPGAHMNFFIVKQLPVLPPSAYTPADIDFIAPRVLELVYTANDLRPFAEDMGYHGEPFRWDEVRRAQIRAELDAYYARLYGLTRDELRYILDPKEVHGEDFPGETFRVLKEKEVRLYGEYRTSRLVLEAWERVE